jgi:hypothetical protein
MPDGFVGNHAGGVLGGISTGQPITARGGPLPRRMRVVGVTCSRRNLRRVRFLPIDALTRVGRASYIASKSRGSRRQPRIDRGEEVRMRRVSGGLTVAVAAVLCSAAFAQQPLVIRPLVEREVGDLPAGELVWRIEIYPSIDAAQAAAGRWSLVAEADGRVWLFTLGAAGGSSPGGTKVSEVGPIPRVSAPRYLLRINEATGAPGSVTPVHSHPGSEAYYVLAGEQSVRGAHGTMVIKAGTPEAGHGPAMAMQVSSSGSSDLESLVMFVVDATQPFSSPASLP